MNKDFAESCLRYLDGDLSQDELRAFEQLLVTSCDAADLLSQLAMDEQHYRTTPAASDGNVLADLLKLEAIAQPLPHDAAWHDDAGQGESQPTDDYQGTLKALGDPSFWGYLAKATMRSKPMKWAGAAAVVLLTATLVIVFVSGPSNPSQTPDIAGTNNDPAHVDPTNPLQTDPLQTNAVATITATHNAQWSTHSAGGASALPVLGSKLHPNTHLTLTAGFAEITTHRGAIAILEAPATVELLNNDNAICLHAGKLVGICETDSSKGFVVKTDHAVITDIGTEFGVEVSDTGLTRLHVYRGQVLAAAIDQDGQPDKPRGFSTGQAADISFTEGIQTAVFDGTRFAAGRDYTLAGQIKASSEPGLSLAPGDIESNDTMLLVPERKSVRLLQPLEVVLPTSDTNIKPGRHTLDTATHLDSYVIHFDSAESSDGRESLTLRAEVRFDRPILGLILDSKQLHDTSALFGSADLQYADAEFLVGIDSWGDTVTVSPDGKTLRLSLSAQLASEVGIDQIRVLVEAKTNRTQP